jgi:hypothetical protein
MPGPSRNTYLSKSLFMRGLQCHKSLYLHKHQPELRGEPTPELLALWRTGREVGAFAQNLFPGGVEIPFDGLSKPEQLSKTREEIAKGAKVLYEATFSFDNVFVKADILRRSGLGFDLYEVKSATEIKDHFPDDVAIQYYVLSGSGIPIRKAHLVHINNEYVRKGEIVPSELFVIEDVTKLVKEKQSSIPELLAAMRKMLGGKPPNIDIGPYCNDPYDCDFIDHCWQHVPDYSVFNLKGKGVNKWELYQQRIIKLADVPVNLLNAKQRMQVEYFLNRSEHANKEAIREFLRNLRYPICFLDFETIRSAIPLYDDTRPYQQVPFQYSLHRQDAKKEAAKHFEFLAQPGMDPRRELTEKIIWEIPKGACVLVYNMSFEKGVLSNLAEYFPEYRKRLNDIVDNLVDLMEPFRRRDIYHWEMDGSYSLKAVLPVLVPDMSYKGLAISDGDMASEAYFAMEKNSDAEEQQNLRNALLEYCRQDSLGMVRILEKMQEMTGSPLRS